MIPRDADFALVPSAKGMRVLRIRDGQIDSMTSGMFLCNRHTWLADGRFAVLTKRQGKHALWRQVTVMACDGPRVTTEARLETPLPAADLIAFAGRLFVCGTAEGRSRLWSIDARAPDAVWQPLPMPAELGDRKGIDALVQDGRVLVAVDNIVFPKWMLRYTVDVDDSFRLDAVIEMKANGTYESVRSASSGALTFAVESSTVGMFGARRYLVMYRFDTLECLGGVELSDVKVDFAMHGDGMWLLDPSRPDRVFRFDANALNGQVRPWNELREACSIHALGVPCRSLVRTRHGRALAIPAISELPLALPD